MKIDQIQRPPKTKYAHKNEISKFTIISLIKGSNSKISKAGPNQEVMYPLSKTSLLFLTFKKSRQLNGKTTSQPQKKINLFNMHITKGALLHVCQNLSIKHTAS